MASISAVGKALNKRQADKQKTKALKESYFLINWLDDADPLVYDVVASKTVVPPENMSIFDVAPGTICRVFFNSQYYRAKVIETGTKTMMSKKQKEIEEYENEDTYTCSDLEGDLYSSNSSEDYSPKTKKMKKSASSSAPKASTSAKSAASKQKSIKVSKKQPIDLVSSDGDNTVKNQEKQPIDLVSNIKDQGKYKVPKSNKKVVDSTNYEWQKQYFNSEPYQVNENDHDQRSGEIDDDKKEGKFGNEEVYMYCNLSKRIDHLEECQQTNEQLARRVDKLEDTVRKLKLKLKARELEMEEVIMKCDGTHIKTECSPPQINDGAKEADIPGDGDNVLIGGQKVDRIKLQAAKLQTDATKCALQLASCLFNLEELTNGNPSGVTNSKDEVRKRTLEKLDPKRMKYIIDYIQEKWPKEVLGGILKKITQKCTDAYKNNKELRHT